MKDHIEVSLPKPEPKHVHITFRSKNLGTLISQFISTLIGSVFFLVGGILYYPLVIKEINQLIYGWFFFVGGILLTFSVILEWISFSDFSYFEQKQINTEYSGFKNFLILHRATNNLIQLIGIFLVLAGGICLIPHIGLYYNSYIIYTTASLVLFFSQLWRFGRIIARKMKKTQDFFNFSIQLNILLSIIFYLVASLLLVTRSKNFNMTGDFLVVAGCLLVVASFLFLTHIIITKGKYRN